MAHCAKVAGQRWYQISSGLQGCNVFPPNLLASLSVRFQDRNARAATGGTSLRASRQWPLSASVIWADRPLAAFNDIFPNINTRSMAREEHSMIKRIHAVATRCIISLAISLRSSEYKNKTD